MPYSSAAQTLSRRVQETRLLQAVCRSGDVSEDAVKSIRGHLFVALHAMYERCVSDCVFTAIYTANRLAVPVNDMKHGFRLMALLPQFHGYRDCAMKGSWPRGVGILSDSVSNAPGVLQAVFPSDGSFMRPSQLELIWSLFELPGEPWPEPRLKRRIEEIVDARNAVAHGRLAASERGAQLSDTEMADRIDDFELLCTHIVGQFAGQLSGAAGFVR